MLGELRHDSGVVDVGMGQDKRIDRFRVEGKGPVVEFGNALGALEHAAIDEDARRAHLQEIAGAGDGAGGAVESELDGHDCSSSVLGDNEAAAL